MVYDGISNDIVAIPTVGPTVDSGSARGEVPAHDLAEIVLSGSAAIAPGCYLLGLEQEFNGRKDGYSADYQKLGIKVLPCGMTNSAMAGSSRP